MVDNISSNIRSGWYLFPPGSFDLYFHVQIKRPFKSKKLVVF